MRILCTLRHISSDILLLITTACKENLIYLFQSTLIKKMKLKHFHNETFKVTAIVMKNSFVNRTVNRNSLNHCVLMTVL